MAAKSDPLRKLMKDRIPGSQLPYYLVETDFVNETDHIVALSGASAVDVALQDLFISRFVPLGGDKIADLFEDGRNGPLSSLSSKNRLGFAMGLYSADVYADIDLIRRVRNVFAHASKAVKFTQEDIYRECQKLRLLRAKMSSDEATMVLEAKHFFAATCLTLTVYMSNLSTRPDVVAHEDLQVLWAKLI